MRPPFASTPLLLLALIVALSGCDDAPIVETYRTSTPTASSGPSDAVSASRTVTLEAGDAGRLTSPSRVVAMPSGDFVWVQSSPPIHVFDAQGQYVRSIGPRGRGPGETVAPTDAAADADGNLYIYDAATSRIHVFDTSYAFVRTLPADVGLVHRFAVGPEGQLHFLRNVIDEHLAAVVTTDADGRVRRRIGRAPDEARVQRTMVGGGIGVSADGTVYYAYLTGPDVWAVPPEGRPERRAYAPAGFVPYNDPGDVSAVDLMRSALAASRVQNLMALSDGTVVLHVIHPSGAAVGPTLEVRAPDGAPLASGVPFAGTLVGAVGQTAIGVSMPTEEGAPVLDLYRLDDLLP